MFCFDKLHFLLVVGDMLEENFFGIPHSYSLVDNSIEYFYMRVKITTTLKVQISYFVMQMSSHLSMSCASVTFRAFFR